MIARLLRALATAVVLASLSGCALFPARTQWVSIKPVRPDVEAKVDGIDAYYAAAVSAISRRDYAQALDMLQAANARKGDDVRVLNAFAVVYDKLGRFDLSARYYARAQQADASSTIVASNLAYSEALQERYAAPPPATLVEAQGPMAPAAVATGVVRLGLADPPAPVRLRAATPLILARAATPSRRGLEIADASGHPRGVATIRLELARLGWTTPRAPIPQSPQTIARTTITYAAFRAPVARSLARTLPYGVRLVDCHDRCSGIRLTLGVDSARWPSRERAILRTLGQ
ncbi:MAG TPA: hypothetical protein VIE16_10480 [Phenylobacterium sp.]|jgi:hypothetical protein